MGLSGQWEYVSLIPALRGQRQVDPCVQGSRVYKVSFGTGRATQRNSVSKEKKNCSDPYGKKAGVLTGEDIELVCLWENRAGRCGLAPCMYLAEHTEPCRDHPILMTEKWKHRR